MFWSSDIVRAQRVLSVVLASAAASLASGCADLASEHEDDTSSQVSAPSSLLDAGQLDASPASGPRDASVADASAPLAADCAGGAQVDLSLIGWATESGGTTGGKGGRTQTVRTAAELVQALKDKRKNPAPLTLLVSGTFTAASAGVSKFEVKELENLSLIGAGAGATFDGIGIKINKARNVVVRNLRIQRVRTGDKDAISVEGPVDHVWVDHCDLSAELEGVGKDDYDGLLDTKAESSFLTYSWNHLHDSWKASLVGSSESDTYDRKLTLHHNWFENVNSRLPLFRGGTGHVFNNLYERVVDSAINTRLGACLRVEANAFAGVQNPWFSAYSDVLGGAELRCNLVDVASRFFHDDERHVPTVCAAPIPYAYAGALNRADALGEVVRANAGVGKLADPTAF
ncbi:MAG: pectate lyase [Polyangiales bacterium]